MDAAAAAAGGGGSAIPPPRMTIQHCMILRPTNSQIGGMNGLILLLLTTSPPGSTYRTLFVVLLALLRWVCQP